jgi:hypothetical protein
VFLLAYEVLAAAKSALLSPAQRLTHSANLDDSNPCNNPCVVQAQPHTVETSSASIKHEGTDSYLEKRQAPRLPAHCLARLLCVQSCQVGARVGARVSCVTRILSAACNGSSLVPARPRPRCRCPKCSWSTAIVSEDRADMPEYAALTSRYYSCKTAHAAITQRAAWNAFPRRCSVVSERSHAVGSTTHPEYRCQASLQAVETNCDVSHVLLLNRPLTTCTTEIAATVAQLSWARSD